MNIHDKQRLLIGQLAKLGEVKPDTIRFYEKQGLLPRPGRAANAYRVYDESALSRLRFIKQAQALGFTLDEIHRILSLRGQGKETCRCVVSIAEATLEETGRKLKELQAFHDALKETLARWRRLSHRAVPMASEFCALIESSRPLETSEPPFRPRLRAKQVGKAARPWSHLQAAECFRKKNINTGLRS